MLVSRAGRDCSAGQPGVRRLTGPQRSRAPAGDTDSLEPEGSSRRGTLLEAWLPPPACLPEWEGRREEGRERRRRGGWR